MLFACLKLICHILAYALEHVPQRSFFLRGKAAKHDAIDATALIFPSGKGMPALLGDIEGTRAAVTARNARQEALALQRIEQARHSRGIDGVEAGDFALCAHAMHRDIRKDARLALPQPQASGARTRRVVHGMECTTDAHMNIVERHAQTHVFTHVFVGGRLLHRRVC